MLRLLVEPGPAASCLHIEAGGTCTYAPPGGGGGSHAAHAAATVQQPAAGSSAAHPVWQRSKGCRCSEVSHCREAGGRCTKLASAGDVVPHDAFPQHGQQ